MSFSQLIESHQRFHSKHLVRSLHVWKKKVANFVWLIYNIYNISYITSHNKSWFFQLQFCEFVTSAGRPTGFKKPPSREVSARMAAMTEEWMITWSWRHASETRKKETAPGFFVFTSGSNPIQKHTIDNYNIWGYYLGILCLNKLNITEWCWM